MKTKHMRHIIAALLAAALAAGAALPASAAAPNGARLDWAVAESVMGKEKEDRMSVAPTGDGGCFAYAISQKDSYSVVKRYGSDGRLLSIGGKGPYTSRYDGYYSMAASTGGNYFRTLNSGRYAESAVAKYAASGKKLWEASMEKNDRALALSGIPDGGVYVVGSNSYWVESDICSYDRIFVARYGPGGGLMWRRYIMPGQERESDLISEDIYGVATLSGGGVAFLDMVYVNYIFKYEFYLEVFDADGNHAVNKKILTDRDSKMAYDGTWLDAGGVTCLYNRWGKGNKRIPRMARYGLSGKKLYDKAAPHFSWTGAASTPDGGFVAVGEMSRADARRSWRGLKVRGKSDAVIFKYDRAGKMEWRKRFGGSDTDRFLYVAVDRDGKMAVACKSDRKSVGTYGIKKVKGIKKAHRKKGVIILARFSPIKAKPAAKG